MEKRCIVGHLAPAQLRDRRRQKRQVLPSSWAAVTRAGAIFRGSYLLIDRAFLAIPPANCADSHVCVSNRIYMRFFRLFPVLVLTLAACPAPIPVSTPSPTATTELGIVAPRYVALVLAVGQHDE